MEFWLQVFLFRVSLISIHGENEVLVIFHTVYSGYMPDIKITYKGREIDSTEAAERFMEFLLVEGELGPVVDQFGEYLQKFLEKVWKD